MYDLGDHGGEETFPPKAEHVDDDPQHVFLAVSLVDGSALRVVQATRVP